MTAADEALLARVEALLASGQAYSGRRLIVFDADLRALVARVRELEAESKTLRDALVPFAEFGSETSARTDGVWMDGVAIPGVTWEFAIRALAQPAACPSCDGAECGRGGCGMGSDL